MAVTVKNIMTANYRRCQIVLCFTAIYTKRR